jgi:hypothetical protein
MGNKIAKNNHYIPNEIIEMILLNVHPLTIHKCNRVSKQFYRIMNKENFWKERLKLIYIGMDNSKVYIQSINYFSKPLDINMYSNTYFILHKRLIYLCIKTKINELFLEYSMSLNKKPLIIDALYIEKNLYKNYYDRNSSLDNIAKTFGLCVNIYNKYSIYNIHIIYKITKIKYPAKEFLIKSNPNILIIDCLF